MKRPETMRSEQAAWIQYMSTASRSPLQMSGNLSSLGIALLIVLMSGCAANPTMDESDGDGGGDAEAEYSIREDVSLSTDMQRDLDHAIQLLRAEEYEKGIELLTGLIQDPKAQRNAAPFIDLAIAYRKLGDLDRAEENLKRALSISPGHPVANNEYGMVLRKEGRFSEARAAYEAALRGYPEFLPARRNLGVLCDLYLGDLECALDNYRAYSAAAPADRTIAIWIADVEKRLSR